MQSEFENVLYEIPFPRLLHSITFCFSGSSSSFRALAVSWTDFLLLMCRMMSFDAFVVSKRWEQCHRKSKMQGEKLFYDSEPSERSQTSQLLTLSTKSEVSFSSVSVCVFEQHLSEVQRVCWAWLSVTRGFWWILHFVDILFVRVKTSFLTCLYYKIITASFLSCNHLSWSSCLFLQKSEDVLLVAAGGCHAGRDPSLKRNHITSWDPDLSCLIAAEVTGLCLGPAGCSHGWS